MAQMHVAVLHVERPEAELVDGEAVVLDLAPDGEDSFGLDRYCALDGGDYDKTCAALLGAGFAPHDPVFGELQSAAATVPVVLLGVTVPETELRDSAGVDLTVQSGGQVVSIGGGRQFALEGKDYDETCSALRGAGFDLHRGMLDALAQATLGG